MPVLQPSVLTLLKSSEYTDAWHHASPAAASPEHSAGRTPFPSCLPARRGDYSSSANRQCLLTQTESRLPGYNCARTLRRRQAHLDKILIRGGVPLTGTVRVSGSKNGALAIMAACLLANGRSTIPKDTDIVAIQPLD